MATSGTYAWLPTAGDLTLQAFVRAGVPRTNLTPQHMQDGLMESNLMLAEWSNKVPNLWTSELHTVALIDGTATYTLPTRIVAIQIAYISTTVSSVTTDRVIMPLSTTEYGAVPTKTNEAPPTAYWFDRQITPQITMWPVPDQTSVYTLKLRCLSQFQDTVLKSGADAEVPYRWLDAYCWGLAARLAVIHNAERAQALEARADKAWAIAAEQDQEDAPIRVLPGLSGYYR